jgi:hypothetical protein
MRAYHYHAEIHTYLGDVSRCTGVVAVSADPFGPEFLLDLKASILSVEGFPCDSDVAFLSLSLLGEK